MDGFISINLKMKINMKRIILYIIFLLTVSYSTAQEGVTYPSRSVGSGIFKNTPPSSYQPKNGIFQIDTSNNVFWIHKGNGVYETLSYSTGELDSFTRYANDILTFQDNNGNVFSRDTLTKYYDSKWQVENDTLKKKDSIASIKLSFDKIYLKGKLYDSDETVNDGTKIASSDVDGFFKWITPNYGDDLGNHTATEDVDANNFSILNVDQITTLNNRVKIGANSNAGIYSVSVGTQTNQANGITNTVAIGYRAARTLSNTMGQNVALGSYCLETPSSSSNRNVAIGYLTARSIDGFRNVSIGSSNSSDLVGSYNTILGSNTGLNYNGSYNSIVGAYSDGLVGSYNQGLGNNIFTKATTSNSVAIGYRSSESMTGDRNISIGPVTQLSVEGDDNIAIGYQSIKYADNSANRNVAVGHLSMENAVGLENTAIGNEAFSTTYPSATANTFLPADVTVGTFQITIPSHGFGAIGESFIGICASTGSFPSPLVGGGANYQFRVISSDVIEYISLSDDFTNQGTGTHTITKAENINNSTAIGNDAQVTKSNQIQLGDTNIEEVKTYGDLLINSNAKGVILISPDGSKWRITVDNSGNLSTVSIP